MLPMSTDRLPLRTDYALPITTPAGSFASESLPLMSAPSPHCTPLRMCLCVLYAIMYEYDFFSFFSKNCGGSQRHCHTVRKKKNMCMVNVVVMLVSRRLLWYYCYYTRTHAHTHKHTRIHIIYMHTYTHAHTHTQTHTHTHTTHTHCLYIAEFCHTCAVAAADKTPDAKACG